MAAARVLDPSSIPLKRQSGGNIWATLVHITQALTLFGLVSLVMLFFLPVIQKQKELNAEKARLQRSITTATDQQRQLMLETEHMKSDPAYVEHIARDKLNMGRPGETVMRFNPYKDSVAGKPSTDDVMNSAR